MDSMLMVDLLSRFFFVDNHSPCSVTQADQINHVLLYLGALSSSIAFIIK